MKHLFLFLFMFLIMGQLSVFSQDVLLDDFESGNLGWEPIDQVYFTIADNPKQDAVNPSAKVMQINRFANGVDWAGIILRDKKEFSVGVIQGQYRYVSMKVLKTANGNISMKLEKSADKVTFEKTASYAPTGEWQEVVFDFYSAAAAGMVFDDFFVMPDRSTNAGTIYIDDITFQPDPNARKVDGIELPGEFELVWADEFNNNSYDTEIWAPQIAGDGFGNNELEYYTGNDKNIFTRDGNLVLKAFKENYQGRNYTSGKLWTRNLKGLKYGRVEARFKLPKGKGVWPAIWLLPQEEVYGGWPNSGEIDMMEFVGFEPNNIHATVHRGTGYGGSGGSASRQEANIDDYQTIRIDWEPGSIKWYLNDTLFHTYNNAYVDELGAQQWPFDQEFYLILNLAVGGDWGGAQGIDDAIWPQEFLIDYVRVYQKKEQTTTKSETVKRENGFSAQWISNDKLKLEFPNSETHTVHIFSPTGEEKITKIISSENPVIDLSGLDKGIYLISVSDNNIYYSQKIVRR